MWQKRRKTLLVGAGILYVIFGVLAFFDVPGGHDEHHHSFAHNLTHIVLGVLLLVLTLTIRPAARRGLALVFATGYLLIAILGFVAGKEATLVVLPGVLEFHAGDYAVHGATALVFLVLGLLKRSDAETATPPPVQPPTAP